MRYAGWLRRLGPDYGVKDVDREEQVIVGDACDFGVEAGVEDKGEGVHGVALYAASPIR